MRKASEQPTKSHGNSAEHTESLAEFRSVISSSFVPLQVTTERGASLLGRISSTAADDVTFTEVDAQPHLVERTPETIADGGTGYYKVSLLLSGRSILVQDGKELVMEAGDLSVYDTSRPYSLLFDGEFRNLIMMFPKDRLDLPIPLTEQLTAAPLSQEHPGFARIISAFLSQFPMHLEPLDARLRAKLAHTSIDLVGTLFSEVLDAEPARRDPHQAMLRNITAYIDSHLAMPNLSPGEIAAAHFISTRHLHALFQTTGTTVSAWVRKRRLERCRTDLLDPSLGERTASAIAAGWGFPDAAHFSRLFKATYGISPSQARTPH